MLVYRAGVDLDMIQLLSTGALYIYIVLCGVTEQGTAGVLQLMRVIVRTALSDRFFSYVLFSISTSFLDCYCNIK